MFALGHWVKGRVCPLPNIYYLKIPTFFQTRYIFVTNVQSTHQKVYYYSWLQLMTYFFSSTEARKIFSSCRIISGGFIGCLFHPPLYFVAKVRVNPFFHDLVQFTILLPLKDLSSVHNPYLLAMKNMITIRSRSFFFKAEN